MLANVCFGMCTTHDRYTGHNKPRPDYIFKMSFMQAHPINICNGWIKYTGTLHFSV